jgi:hemolysin III
MSMTAREVALRLRDFTRKELIADSVIHVIGIVAALAGAAVLLAAVATRGTARELAVVTIYSCGLITMLLCSFAYNLFRTSRFAELLRSFDHSAIFAMIAGTYTPFTVLRLEGLLALASTSVVWLTAASGVGLRLLRPHLFDRLSIGFYLVLGWIGILVIDPMLDTLRLSTVLLLAAGGLLYSIGVVFHLCERLPFQNAIWHAFVLTAAGVHYAAILDEIVMFHMSR